MTTAWRDRVTQLLSHPYFEAATLLLVRLSLAGIFWRSGRTKIAEGSWFSISDTTYYLFREDYRGVPLPPDLAAALAVISEHVFPLLLAIGLFTRLSAFALFAMTMVIQLFVFPEAWWQTHALWAALALVLVTRGGGLISLDALAAGWARR